MIDGGGGGRRGVVGFKLKNAMWYGMNRPFYSPAKSEKFHISLAVIIVRVQLTELYLQLLVLVARDLIHQSLLAVTMQLGFEHI